MGGLQAVAGSAQRPVRRGLLLALLVVLAAAGVSQAATLRVTTTDDSNDASCTQTKCSLRDAVTYAHAGDTVLLPASSRPYRVTQGEIEMTQPLTVKGAGSSRSVIQDDGSSRVFDVFAQPTTRATVTLEGVKITGGHATAMPGGGAVLVDAASGGVPVNLVVSDSAIDGNSAAVSAGDSTCCGGGGGIYSAGGTITIEHSSISNDTATVTATTPPTGDTCCDGGGGVYDNTTGNGSITVLASTLAHDSATVSAYDCCHGGGAIYSDGGPIGTVAISNSKLTDDTLTVQGTQTDVTTGDGNCCSGGGALYQDSANAAVTIRHSALTQDKATVDSGACCHGGGGVYMDTNNLLTVKHSTLAHNVATVNGPTGTDASRRDHGYSGGGAAAVFGGMVLGNATLSDNTANVRSGDAFNGGGAIQLDTGQTLTARDTTISGNRSLVSANAAFSGGGGVFEDTSSDVGSTYTNSTISGNTTNAAAAQGAGGGGLFVLDTSASGDVLANATLAGNSAPAGAGGGILDAGSKLSSHDSIVALNAAQRRGNCAGVRYQQSRPRFASLGFNLTTFPDSCSFTAHGDRLVTRSVVRLGPLANNGGPTMTRALLKGSPAIDYGDPAGCADPAGKRLRTDQRGRPRPDRREARCDIGAYEYQDKSAK